MTTTLMGFAFPFRIEGGSVARSSGVKKVEENIRHLLSTRVGERLMLRGYGGGVHRRLQDPNSGTLQALVKREIEDALRANVPEARLVAPIRVASVEAELRVTIEYVVEPEGLGRELTLSL
jgi:phage baseplate assembly protein W